jgi:hypothetical protein
MSHTDFRLASSTPLAVLPPPLADAVNAEQRTFFSIRELAERWRCSRGTVYNRLRASGAKVLDFATRGRRGRKVVPAGAVLEMESRNLKRLC